MKINPSIVVKAWHEYVVLPYSKQINESDWSFFMRKDYEKDIGNVLEALDKVREEKDEAQLKMKMSGGRGGRIRLAP